VLYTLRIFFFIPALNAGGAERVIVTLANYFAHCGHEVEILTFNNGSSFYNIDSLVHVKGMNITFANHGFKKLFEIVNVESKRKKALIQEANSFKPDVIVSFLFTTNIIAIMARNKLKSPVIVSERNDPLHYSFFKRMLCKYLYNKSDGIVCQGKMVESFYKNKRRARTKIIPNPVNSAAIGDYSPQRTKRIIAVGRLISAKNFPILIKAFSMLPGECSQFILEIYGEGPLKQELMALIKQFNMEKRIFLMGNKKDVMKHISNASCFVLCSNFEGFPNVLLEAMASGLPVISTNFTSGVAKELIEDGVNGYVVPVDDVSSLNEAVVKIISSNKTQNLMGKNNLSVRERFSEKSVCQQWEDFINYVIKAK